MVTEDKDKNARDTIEHAGKQAEKPGQHPAAGPHAKDHLTDESKTPGSGALPERDTPEVDAGPD